MSLYESFFVIVKATAWTLDLYEKWDSKIGSKFCCCCCRHLIVVAVVVVGITTHQIYTRDARSNLRVCGMKLYWFEQLAMISDWKFSFLMTILHQEGRFFSWKSRFSKKSVSKKSSIFSIWVINCSAFIGLKYEISKIVPALKWLLLNWI